MGLSCHINWFWKASRIQCSVLRFWQPYLPLSALPWDFKEILSWRNPDPGKKKSLYCPTGIYDVSFSDYINRHLTFSTYESIDRYITISCGFFFFPSEPLYTPVIDVTFLYYLIFFLQRVFKHYLLCDIQLDHFWPSFQSCWFIHPLGPNGILYFIFFYSVIITWLSLYLTVFFLKPENMFVHLRIPNASPIAGIF